MGWDSRRRGSVSVHLWVHRYEFEGFKILYNFLSHELYGLVMQECIVVMYFRTIYDGSSMTTQLNTPITVGYTAYCCITYGNSTCNEIWCVSK